MSVPTGKFEGGGGGGEGKKYPRYSANFGIRSPWWKQTAFFVLRFCWSFHTQRIQMFFRTYKIVYFLLRGQEVNFKWRNWRNDYLKSKNKNHPTPKHNQPNTTTPTLVVLKQLGGNQVFVSKSVQLVCTYCRNAFGFQNCYLLSAIIIKIKKSTGNF